VKRILGVIAVVAVIGLAFAAPAYAAQGGEGDNTGCNGQGNPNSPCQGTTHNGGAGGSSTAVSVSNASAKSTSTSGAVGIGGAASASYEGYTGQSQSVRVDTPRQAPAVLAPALSVSSLTCMASVSVGASTPFGGAALGVPKLDKGCEKRANAMILHTLGQSQAALRLMAQDSAVKQALAESGLSFAVAVPDTSVPALALKTSLGRDKPVTVSPVAIFSEPTVRPVEAAIQGQ
jgi:hypothetical protein